MAILKATVLTRINKICKRSETDIDDILLESMLEISERTGNLAALATATTVAEISYVSAPTDLAGKQIHSVHLDDERPLLPISWSKFLNDNRGGHGASQHSYNDYNREGYCYYKKRIYISPPTSGGRTVNIEYSKLDDDVSSIELPDEFLGAIVRLTAAKLYEKYEMWDKLDKEMTLYERALALLHSETALPPVAMAGNDLEM